MIKTSEEAVDGKEETNGGVERYHPDALKEGFWRRYYYQIVTLVEVFIDFGTVFLAFLLARGLHLLVGMSRYQMPPMEPMSPEAAIHVVGASGIMVFVFASMGLYRKTPSLLNVDEIRKLFRSVLVLAVVVFTISFYFRIPFSRILITIWLVFILFFMIIEKMIFYKLHQALHLRGVNIRRVLIYGAGEIGRKLFKNIIAFPKLGFHAIGFVDMEMDSFKEELQRMDVTLKSSPKILGTYRDLDKIVETYQIDDLFIAKKGMSSEEILAVTTKCRDLGIQFKMIPQLYGYFIENLSLQAIGGIPLIGEKVTPIRNFDLVVKRIIDVVFSLLVLLFFLPVFLAIGVLIKQDSPGPVVFRQRRVGKKGKEFTIYKFRTMYVEAPKYSFCPKNSEDPRITPVGRFLRKTSLDELPQFLNVLKGEMSLVGPRPEMPFIVAQYNSLHRERLSVKPGLTGLWQISADRQMEIHENIDYDLYYMENFSILLDVAIIARTVIHGLLAMKTA
jgi:exopolysaccharide biosynthesis polyprenyl glycosylphosphotransferase